jgi:hypothetical protein
MKTLKNLLATATLMITMLSVNATTPLKNEMLPATFYNGEVITIKTLPMVTITPPHKKMEGGYTLPMVTIVENKIDRFFAPAVKYNGSYIASINLPMVEIIAKRKPMAFATMYRMFKYFTNWV